MLSKSDPLQNAGSLRRGEDNPLYQQVVSYLEAKQETSTSYQAAKIDTLLENLSHENTLVIEIDDSTDVIVCDLASYVNEAIPEYSNVYYKAYFEVIAGEVSHGLILTVYTDLSREAFDSDFENIFNHDSQGFTGETDVNELDGEYVQGFKFYNGQLQESYWLSTLNEEGQSTSGENCTTWYLVTTTIYSDGHIERDWEILYTLCDGCIPTNRRVSTFYSDCDPDNIGGGGAPFETEDTEEFILSVNVNGPSLIVCPEIVNLRHSYTKHMRNGRLVGVSVYPVSCANPIIECADGNKIVTRKVTVYNQTQGARKVGLGFEARWECDLFARYIYLDGTPEVNVYDEHIHTRTIN